MFTMNLFNLDGNDAVRLTMVMAMDTEAPCPIMYRGAKAGVFACFITLI